MLVKDGGVPSFELTLVPTDTLYAFLRVDRKALVGKDIVLGARIHRPVEKQAAVIYIDSSVVDYRVAVGDLQILGAGIEKLALRAEDVLS